jgi:hypothetical protein
MLLSKAYNGLFTQSQNNAAGVYNLGNSARRCLLDIRSRPPHIRVGGYALFRI